MKINMREKKFELYFETLKTGKNWKKLVNINIQQHRGRDIGSTIESLDLIGSPVSN